MAGSDVKLLGTRQSPFVNRAEFALKLKSVNYEFHQEDLAAKSELLLKSNPVHEKVPVLIHGDKPICETLVIVQYIDETWLDAPSLLPSDPYERATARFWAAYIDDKWIPMLMAFSDAKGDSKAEGLEKLIQGLALLEDALVKSSKGKEFFGGDRLGYLDIVLGCCVGWVKVQEIVSKMKILDETRTPALVKWAEKFASHQAVKATVPDTEQLLNLLRMMEAKKTAAANHD